MRPPRRHDASNRNKVPSIFEAPVLWIHPQAKDAVPYEVDLTAFIEGAEDDEKGGGKFVGRPAFAFSFAKFLVSKRPPEVTYRSHHGAMVVLLRFLSGGLSAPLFEPKPPFKAHANDNKTDDTPITHGDLIESVHDLRDEHGTKLQQWLSKHGLQTYKAIHTLVIAFRKGQSLRPLRWTVEVNEEVPDRREIDFKLAVRLFSAIKKEAKQVKAMLKEGEDLASRGIDPRVPPITAKTSAWDIRENQAWLAKTIMYDEANPGRCASTGSDSDPVEGHPHLPEYGAPGMRRIAIPTERDVFYRQLRWFGPGFQDTALFLWLFLFKTGWNLGTVLSIDLDADWASDDVLRPGFKTLGASKARAGRIQFASSDSKPEWHPFQIVSFMKEATEPLRAIARARLTEARLKARNDTSSALVQTTRELEAVCRSPWIYHDVGERIEVHRMVGRDCSQLNDVARSIVRKNALAGKGDPLSMVMTSDARHIWIGHVYERSDLDLFAAKAAAQHATLRTTRRYIRTKRLRAAGEDLYRAFQDAAFVEIAAGRPLDPASLRRLVEEDQITRKQERTLLDPAMRTKLGMGCKEPYNPPRKVAPGHRAGELCGVQRCTGCVHGVVFDESLPHLARRLVNLDFLQRSIPPVSWANSSYEAERTSIEATLSGFDPKRVEAALNEWSGKFERKECHVEDAFPA